MKANKNLYDIGGRLALVTGGGGVLGFNMAKYLARQGSRIVLLDINADQASRNAEEIIAAGGEAVAFKLDVLARADVEAMAEKIESEFGVIDILINAVGGNVEGSTILNAIPIPAIR